MLLARYLYFGCLTIVMPLLKRKPAPAKVPTVVKVRIELSKEDREDLNKIRKEIAQKKQEMERQARLQQLEAEKAELEHEKGELDKRVKFMQDILKETKDMKENIVLRRTLNELQNRQISICSELCDIQKARLQIIREQLSK